MMRRIFAVFSFLAMVSSCTSSAWTPKVGTDWYMPSLRQVVNTIFDTARKQFGCEVYPFMELKISEQKIAEIGNDLKLTFSDSPGYVSLGGKVTINIGWICDAMRKKIISAGQEKDLLWMIICHEIQHIRHDHAYKTGVWLRKRKIGVHTLKDRQELYNKLTKDQLYLVLLLERIQERQADMGACIGGDNQWIPQVIRGGVLFYSRIRGNNCDSAHVKPDLINSTHPSDHSRYTYFSSFKKMYENKTMLTPKEKAQHVLCGHEYDPKKQCPKFINAWFKAARKV